MSRRCAHKFVSSTHTCYSQAYAAAAAPAWEETCGTKIILQNNSVQSRHVFELNLACCMQVELLLSNSGLSYLPEQSANANMHVYIRVLRLIPLTLVCPYTTPVLITFMILAPTVIQGCSIALANVVNAINGVLLTGMGSRGPGT